MFQLNQAMRYYRLWIYTSNAVLLISVLVFLAAAVAIVSHPYISLVPTPAPYHPSLIYGYLALLLQAGIVQAIGCIGAFRLCPKYLNTYWIVLLLLLLGDILVGLFWIFKFMTLNKDLEPYLSLNIKKYYGIDDDFTRAWDELQLSNHCCGAKNPLDFYENQSYIILPNSCCHLRSLPSKISIHRAVSMRKYIPHRKFAIGQNIDETFTEKLLKELNATCRGINHVPYVKGCSKSVGKWYSNSVETLMILGFCVITFVKLCFTGILRLEIQEMIQKIRVLEGEAMCNPNPELAEALGMGYQSRLSDAKQNMHQDENEILKNTSHCIIRHNHLAGQDGVDSDTNSSCALITDTPVRNINFSSNKKPNGNNNDLPELKELRHIRQTQI